MPGREPFDEDHGTAADRATPQWRGFGRRSRVDVGYRGWSDGQQLFAERDEGATAAAGKEIEMANTHEAAGQDMQQETAQKLVGVKCHHALLGVVSGVSEAEGDFLPIEGDQTLIGDGHAVGVSTEVTVWQLVAWDTDGHARGLHGRASGEWKTFNSL